MPGWISLSWQKSKPTAGAHMKVMLVNRSWNESSAIFKKSKWFLEVSLSKMVQECFFNIYPLLKYFLQDGFFWKGGWGQRVSSDKLKVSLNAYDSQVWAKFILGVWTRSEFSTQDAGTILLVLSLSSSTRSINRKLESEIEPGPIPR